MFELPLPECEPWLIAPDVPGQRLCTRTPQASLSCASQFLGGLVPFGLFSEFL